MGKVSYKEKERQRRELEILDKAAQLLAERGYSNLNMDDLADVVGISKPTLYQHFKSKEELVTQVVLHNFKAMGQQLESWADEYKGTPLQRMKDMMRWMLRNRYRHGNIFSMTDQETMWSVVRNNPMMAEFRRQGQAKLLQLIDTAKAAGEIEPTIPTPIIGRAFFCLQGIFMDKHGEPIVTEQNLDDSIEQVIQLFMCGIAKSDGEK